ncbi:MAG: dockerin type I domain-containing protein [Acutalibacteraceae bacterium]
MKRFLSVILSFTLLTLSFSTVCYAAGEDDASADGTQTPVLGDLNGDGQVDTTEARQILRVSASIEPISDELFSVADINGDGVITLEDAVEALKLVIKIEEPEKPGEGDDAPTEIVIPDKNGDNILSDSPTNEFIQLISKTYGIEKAALVAVYSVPDSGTNYVLRFKKNILTGKYSKAPDNLEYVYHIGVAPERKISYTNGKLILGDHYNCEAAEGVLVFNLVQTTVMEQYPDYFK